MCSLWLPIVWCLRSILVLYGYSDINERMKDETTNNFSSKIYITLNRIFFIGSQYIGFLISVFSDSAWIKIHQNKITRNETEKTTKINKPEQKAI